MKKLLMLAVVVVSSVSFAAAPPPARWDGDKDDRKEEVTKKLHMMLVVGIAEALSLNETEALKLSDKLKGFEEKRRPVREAMVDALKTLKAASDGDATAAAQVDGAVQRLFDSRLQMAQMDKDMFAGLSRDLAPQKRAQLAIFLAKFHAEARGWKGGKGRHHRQ